MTGASRQENLAIVAMHGLPEVTGLKLLESIDAKPVEGWDVIPADEEAILYGKRSGPSGNLATAFPGEFQSIYYRKRRAAELLRKASGYKKIIEVHDDPTDTCGYASLTQESNPELLNVARALGFKAIILSSAKYNLRAINPNVLVAEFGRADGVDPNRVSENVSKLRLCMKLITRGDLPKADVSDFTFYERIREIHGIEARALGLNYLGIFSMFEPLTPEVMERLNMPDGDYAAGNWNGKNSSQGEWFGDLLQVTSSPAGWRNQVSPAMPH